MGSGAGCPDKIKSKFPVLINSEIKITLAIMQNT